jgi:hypothetical protein
MDYPYTRLSEKNMQIECTNRWKQWSKNLPTYSLFLQYIGKDTDVYVKAFDTMGWCGKRQLEMDCMFYSGEKMYVVKKDGDWLYGFIHVPRSSFKEGLETVNVLTSIVMNKNKPDIRSKN